MEMLGAWFLGIIRGLFAAIDKVVVWLIESLYDLIFQISSVQVFDNASLAAFANRITVILSIFMIFKLSLSFLNYIVNPDAMTDKSKGFSKLIQNIAVALVLLVSYQFLFDKAMELQQKIVDNNTIPKLIIGSVGKNVKNSSTISFPLFSAFVVPNNDILYSTSTDPNLTGCRSYSRYIEGSKPSATCDLEGAEYTDNVATDNSTVGTDANSQMDYIVEHQDTNALLDFLLRIKKGDIFAFDYKFIISTICGAFAALVLLSFCMDVAVRIIKLYFLRLIAPIPIISYIDPIKGEGIFKKWLSNVGKTYADLFIRLIAIFFAIFIIQQVATQPALKDFNGNPIDNPFVIIFIIIGALMFAKQFPKLIQDITGISLDGKMQLNPFKKIGEQAVGGKAMLAGAAGAVGALGVAGGNLAHRAVNAKKNFNANGGGLKGGLKTAGGFLTSTLAGATSGFVHSSRQAYSSGKMTQGIKKGIEQANTHRTEREIGKENGATAFGILKAKAQDAVGLPTDYQKSRMQIDNLQNVKKTVDSIDEAAKKEMLIKPNSYLSREWNDDNKKKEFKEASDAYIKAHNQYEALKNVDINNIKQDAVDRYRGSKRKLDEFNKNNGLSITTETTDAEIKNQFKSDDDIRRECMTTSSILGPDGKPITKVDSEAMEKAKKERDQQIEEAKKVRDDYIAVSKGKDKDGKIVDYDENQYASIAEDDHYKKLNEAKDAEFNTGQHAADVYVKMLEDEKETKITNGAISSQLRVVEQTTDKSSAFEEKEVYKGSDFAAIRKQAKKDAEKAYEIESSDDYDKAEASHTAANLGEKSYNNMYNINATKQKKH